VKRLIAGVAVAATLLTACGANDKPAGQAGGGTVKAGGTLYFLSDSPSQQYDPAKSGSLVVTGLQTVHRRLTSWQVAPGKDTTIVPDLATDTGKPSDGGKTWTFTLKDDQKFSDGTTITSADVKWGLERSFAPAFAGGLAYHKDLLSPGLAYKGPFDGGKELDTIETPDAKTIVFHLARPYGDWNWVASTPAFAPVPKGKGAEANYGEHPIASGPYSIKTYERGKGASLVRNPNWKAADDPTRKAYPDNVEWQFGQQTAVISKRLIDDTGNDQNAFGTSFASPAQLAQIQGSASAKSRLVTSESGALAYLAMNTTRGKLTDPNVRKAFQYAVNKSAFQVASAGNAQLAGDIATTLITPGIAGREEFNLYPTKPEGDPDKAKELLTAAGVSSLDGLVLVTKNENGGPEKVAAIQAALARANIHVNIKVLDSDTYTEEVDTKANPDYDLTLASWQPDIPTANANIQPLFQSTEIGGGGVNESRYNNPDVDKLIIDAQATVDPAAAAKKWVEADKKILGDSAVVPLIYTRNSFLHGSKVGNVTIGKFPAYVDYRQMGIIQ
jgi:peptide/nickel transport system substrate-binding protein